MFKKIGLAVGALGVGIAAAGYVLYTRNEPPVVAPIATANIAGEKPFVIKLHAQWCPVCMVTKKVWSQIETDYATRVNLLVLDFTNETTAVASAAEANRLGLGKFFEEYGGWTGTIAVVDGRTNEVKAAINGSRSFDEYRMAIDGALVGSPSSDLGKHSSNQN